MKSILSFIKTTLTGGILFLLPFILIVMLLKEVFRFLFVVSDPISKYLPEIIFGLNGSNIVALFLLICICFVSGLMFRAKWGKKLIAKLENSILKLMPGYALIKSLTADTIGEQIDHNMTPILIKDDTSWNLAFLVEEGLELSTVFIPDAPRHDAGEVKIISSELIKKVDVTTSTFSRSIKNYGKGAVNWIN
jgi:uncharacterized membrane protein